MRTLLSRLHVSEPHRLTKRLLWPVLIVGGLAVGGTAAVAWHMATGLPSLGGLRDYQPSLITKVKADNRQVIGQFYVERRILTPLREVPRHLIDAVLAVEDTRFFEHPGLDIWGILRATWTNFKRGGKVEGASTITQQLARSLFLTPERTFRRKIRELFLALKMEFILTKDQILEMYLNQIYFGHGAYGVGTASLTYFGKALSELQLHESAFLAGLLKAPNTYSPYKKLRPREATPGTRVGTDGPGRLSDGAPRPGGERGPHCPLLVNPLNAWPRIFLKTSANTWSTNTERPWRIKAGCRLPPP